MTSTYKRLFFLTADIHSSDRCSVKASVCALVILHSERTTRRPDMDSAFELNTTDCTLISAGNS